MCSVSSSRADRGHRPRGRALSAAGPRHAGSEDRDRLRIARAREAGNVEDDGRGTVLVRDLERRDLVYVCRPEHGELVVVTLWEEGGEDAAVPRRFTDALRRDDHRVE